MQKIETAQRLQERIRTVLATVEREFRPLTDEQLNWKPDTRQWSITQCLQHLNLAERFYIRNLQKKVDDLGLIQTTPTDQSLEAGMVGRLLRYAVDPDTKMKLPTVSFMNPRPDLNAREVMQQFIELQQLLHELLDKAPYLDWNREKIMTLFGNWIKISVGDAFLMLVAHTERHVNQALRVKQQATGAVSN
ncbi:DinB family protein [Larkinella arboricola]|uniref:DinB family protein n=1 Tax=Larkinella arboricola TaxID=643671 RepID=A0A327X2B4_LARAB|nr:DinB family protein [Larkinella arboricola]RAK00342.1 DinB family protein [Larkinella arboricola]